MFLDGSPSTTMRSANFPGSSLPVLPSNPQALAPLAVAETMASIGEKLQYFTKDSSSMALVPILVIGDPEKSVPEAMVTPPLFAFSILLIRSFQASLSFSTAHDEQPASSPFSII